MLTIGNANLYTQDEMDNAINGKIYTQEDMDNAMSDLKSDLEIYRNRPTFTDELKNSVAEYYCNTYFTGEIEDLTSCERNVLRNEIIEHFDCYCAIDIYNEMINGELLDFCKNHADDIIEGRANVYEITFSRKTYFKIVVKATDLDRAEDAVYDLSDYEIDDYVDYTDDIEIEDYDEYEVSDYRAYDIDMDTTED